MLSSEVGAYRLAYVFISLGRPAEAVESAMGAASALERRMRPKTPEELSVYGGPERGEDAFAVHH